MQTSAVGDVATKILMLVLGLLFLLPPAYKLVTYAVFRFHAITVEGTIADGSRGRDLGGRPFVEYTDQQGNAYEIKSKAKTHWLFAPKVGEKLKVFYDERDPGKAIVNSNIHYIFIPLCFIAAGLGFLFHTLRASLDKVRQSD